MHPLKIDIDRLQHGPVDFPFDVSPEQFDLLEDPEYRFPRNITGTMRAQFVGGDNVLVTGKLATVAETNCVRCLEPVAIPIEVPFQAVFIPDPGADPTQREDPDTDRKLFYESGIIYPTERLREELMLALPYLPVCESVEGRVCALADKDLSTITFASSDPATAEEQAPSSSWQSQLAQVRRQIHGGGNT